MNGIALELTSTQTAGPIKSSRDTRFVLSTEQVCADLNGEMTVLGLKAGIYYGLNEAGCKIWKKLEQPHSLIELRDYLAKEYDVDLAQCERDVERLLVKLFREELIVAYIEP